MATNPDQEIVYARLDEHKALHVQFRKMLRELLQTAKQLTLDEIATQVQYLINGWFYNHIMIADLDYVPFVKTLMVKNELTGQ